MAVVTISRTRGATRQTRSSDGWPIMWRADLEPTELSGAPRVLTADELAFFWASAGGGPAGLPPAHSAPRAKPTWEAGRWTRDGAGSVERAGGEAGAGRHRAAGSGDAALERPLALADFACYEEFLLAALPAETAARVAAAAQWAETAVIGGVAGRILRAAVASQRRLDGVLGRLGSLQTLAELLLIASQELAATIDSLGEVTGAACRASAGVAERAPVLASTAQAMTALGCDLHGIVAALAECLAAVRATVLRLRFGIALARLHTDMVIRFSREVHEGAAPAGGSAHIAALCEAMNDDVGRLAEQVAKSSAALRWTSEGVTRCSAQFGQFQKLLTAWRLQVPRLGLSRELEGLVEPIDRQLAQGLDQIASWRELALRCLNGVAPVDRAAFEESIHEITAALGELGTLVE